MGTTDWVSIISLFSLLLSLAGFIWHVWSKLVFPKPCVAVSFMVMHVVGSDPRQRFLSLDVTNFGLGEVTISCAVPRPRKPWYKMRVAHGVLNLLVDPRLPDLSNGPSTGLPKKLGVGETSQSIFAILTTCFYASRSTRSVSKTASGARIGRRAATSKRYASMARISRTYCLFWTIRCPLFVRPRPSRCEVRPA